MRANTTAKSAAGIRVTSFLTESLERSTSRFSGTPRVNVTVRNFAKSVRKCSIARSTVRYYGHLVTAAAIDGTTRAVTPEALETIGHVDQQR